MKRFAMAHLWEWFNKNDRKPMIIRGARQVGKSTLVKLLAEEYDLDLLEINLEKLKLTTVEKDEFDLNDLIDEIQLRSKKRIRSNTLIFFDEIQESPNLLKYLRYFYEEKPELAVIAAGSLLEIALKSEKFSFPVGRVEFYYLGPMSFSEFLLATKNETLLDKLEKLELSEYVISEAKKLLVKYYYIGGMPKAIQTYIDENSLVSVREIQEQIIQTYIADFPKYNSRINFDRVEKVFYSVASFIGKKIIYTKLSKEDTSRDNKKAIELLIDAKVVLKCSHSDANSHPLAGEMDDSVFKLYFLDIGLLNAIMRLDFEIIDSNLQNNFNTKGMIAEQFVAQHLAYLKNERRGPELFYWLKDKGSKKGEVNFIIQRDDRIVPVEVKAKASGHLKSLFYFCRDKNIVNAIKVSMDDYNREEKTHIIEKNKVAIKLTSLPHYVIEQIYKI